MNTDTKTCSAAPTRCFPPQLKTHGARLAKGGGGWYVIIHADEVSREHRRGYSAKNPKARIETFVVGSGVEIREMVQWWVEGDESEGETSAGLLISEIMIPTQKRNRGTPDYRASAGIKPDA
ncbi:hypothetical protein N7465_005234 [Penicillium sp. CMV-2018d]|nr:hypothetical protein N7465_005234 [Penicillium sp. CMV-2018d]